MSSGEISPFPDCPLVVAEGDRSDAHFGRKPFGEIGPILNVHAAARKRPCKANPMRINV